MGASHGHHRLGETERCPRGPVIPFTTDRAGVAVVQRMRAFMAAVTVSDAWRSMAVLWNRMSKDLLCQTA